MYEWLNIGCLFQSREMSMEIFWMRQGVKHVMEMPLHCLYQTAVETGTYQYNTTETLIYASFSYTFPPKKLTNTPMVLLFRNDIILTHIAGENSTNVHVKFEWRRKGLILHVIKLHYVGSSLLLQLNTKSLDSFNKSFDLLHSRI